MARYRVRGARRDTGADFEIFLDAASATVAEREAQSLGMLVSDVAADLAQPRIQVASASQETPSARTSGRSRWALTWLGRASTVSIGTLCLGATPLLNWLRSREMELEEARREIADIYANIAYATESLRRFGEIREASPLNWGPNPHLLESSPLLLVIGILMVARGVFAPRATGEPSDMEVRSHVAVSIALALIALGYTIGCVLAPSARGQPLSMADERLALIVASIGVWSVIGVVVWARRSDALSSPDPDGAAAP